MWPLLIRLADESESFTQATITDGPLFYPDGPNLLVSWSSSSPAGTWFQVYLNRRRVWSGTSTFCTIPSPRGRSWVDIGTVDTGDELIDFADFLPAPPGTGNRVELTWRGGTYLGSTLIGFNVYMGGSAGAAVDYTTLAEFIPAGVPNAATDGFGHGGFGQGSFGSSPASYGWTTPILGAGVWNFGIKSVDAAGNEGTAATVAKTVSTPPRQPAASSTGVRLSYTYNATTHVAALTWTASPADTPPLSPI